MNEIIHTGTYGRDTLLHVNTLREERIAKTRKEQKYDPREKIVDSYGKDNVHPYVKNRKNLFIVHIDS